VTGTYNLNAKKDFPALFTILSKFKEGKIDEVRGVIEGVDFDAQLSHIASLNKDLKRVTRNGIPSKEQKVEIMQKQQQIDELSGKLLVLNEENRQLRLQSLRTNLESYRKAIRQIQKDLDAKANDEAHFQRSLTESKWIFGPWYEDVHPKRKADTENQPDFVLKRYDGFADVVEIEAPGKELFTKPDKSGKSQPREHLIQALAQVIDYVDSYNTNLQAVFYKDAIAGLQNPLNPYKPRGILIIGRDKKNERQKLRQLNSFLNNVTIMTYDEFLLNGGSMLDFVEKRKSRRT
jgi:TolA-binding protein